LSMKFEPSSTKFYLIGGGNWRKPLTCHKSLTNFIYFQPVTFKFLVQENTIIFYLFHYDLRGSHGCDRMVVDSQLPTQSVPVTTDVVGSTLAQGEVYNIRT
jgi:hypothetical protein